MTRLILALLIAAGVLWARSRRGTTTGYATSFREDDDGIAPMDPRLAGFLG